MIQRNHSDTFIKAFLQWAVGCLIYRYLFKEMICQGLLKKPGSDHVIFSMIHSFACMYMYVYVVVNFLFQLIFIFPLFWGMVMYANEFKTKEKQKLSEVKN